MINEIYTCMGYVLHPHTALSDGTVPVTLYKQGYEPVLIAEVFITSAGEVDEVTSINNIAYDTERVKSIVSDMLKHYAESVR